MDHLLQKSKCSIFHKIFKIHMIFRRGRKVLLWSKGLIIKNQNLLSISMWLNFRRYLPCNSVIRSANSRTTLTVVRERFLTTALPYRSNNMVTLTKITYPFVESLHYVSQALFQYLNYDTISDNIPPYSNTNSNFSISNSSFYCLDFSMNYHIITQILFNPLIQSTYSNPENYLF